MGKKNQSARSANPCPTRHTEATKSPKYPNKSKKIAQPNLARFVVQKIGFKDAVVPSADFLLESEKRGTPPKSEKAAAFWRVGGAGRGVQPFLRKETNESKSKRIASDLQIAKIDSSLTAFAQNDESVVDCHESANADSRNDESNQNDSIANANSSIVSEKSELCSHERGNRTNGSLTKRVASPHDLSPQDEFALFYDESRTIRSVISFTLAGSEPEVIAFGIIESLVDYLVLIFRDAQEKFGTKNMGIIGDIFANKIFFDKITQKIPKDFNLVFPKFLDYD